VFKLEQNDALPPCCRFIRRETGRGLMECALCDLACPNGEGNEKKGMPGVERTI
jgi:hypothetical protein